MHILRIKKKYCQNSFHGCVAPYTHKHACSVSAYHSSCFENVKLLTCWFEFIIYETELKFLYIFYLWFLSSWLCLFLFRFSIFFSIWKSSLYCISKILIFCFLNMFQLFPPSLFLELLIVYLCILLRLINVFNVCQHFNGVNKFCMKVFVDCPGICKWQELLLK